MATDEFIKALVEKARKEDRKAFEELVNLYLPRLEAQIRARMGSKVRSKLEYGDVLQDTLACAFESIKKFKWRGNESFYRWLGSIAEHLIWNASQKKAWVHLQLDDDVADTDVPPSKELRRNERFDRLEKALADLSEDHRKVLLLARVEGLKVKEIAVKMKRSQDAVSKLLTRALLQLKKSFGDTESLHLPDRRFKTSEDKNEQ